MSSSHSLSRASSASTRRACIACITLSFGFAACGPGVDERALEQSRDELSAAASLDRPHCVVETIAVRPGQALPAMSAPEPKCFSTFPEAIAHATKGAVQLRADATPEALRPSLLAPSATFVIGVEWQHASYRGSSYTFTSGVTCAGYVHYVSSMPSGWNDIVSSAQAYSNCNHSVHFEHVNFAGASVDCGSSCSYIGGAMNDRTSSIRWYQ